MTKMRFLARIGEEDRIVDVDNHGADDGFYTMTLDDKSYNVDAQLMRSHIVSALIDSHSYDVDVEKVGNVDDTLNGRLKVRVRGRIVEVDILDERRRKMKEAASGVLGAAGLAVIESPMPGKVMTLLVAEGDEVTQGQGVVVVEAMKMENELKSPKDGVVVSIVCKEGQAVTAGAPLLSVE